MDPEINENIAKLMDEGPTLLMTYGTQIVMALLIFFIGKWLAKLLSNFLEKTMNARGVDKTIGKFTKNIVYYLAVVVVIVATLGEIGVQTASFVAIIGAAGLAVGLALQGSLSNFAAGVLLIMFRPIRVGDFVEAGGTAGVVNEISIFSTIFKTGDNKTVIVANSDIMGGVITNYSLEKTRRVDLDIGVSYEANLQQVRDELQSLISEEERVLPDKDVLIAVKSLGDSAVVFVVRIWVNSGDYWPVYFSMLEKVKNRFDEKGIGIPYPQMDVHVKELAK